MTSPHHQSNHKLGHVQVLFWQGSFRALHGAALGSQEVCISAVRTQLGDVKGFVTPRPTRHFVRVQLSRKSKSSLWWSKWPWISFNRGQQMLSQSSSWADYSHNSIARAASSPEHFYSWITFWSRKVPSVLVCLFFCGSCLHLQLKKLYQTIIL